VATRKTSRSSSKARKTTPRSPSAKGGGRTSARHNSPRAKPAQDQTSTTVTKRVPAAVPKKATVAAAPGKTTTVAEKKAPVPLNRKPPPTVVEKKSVPARPAPVSPVVIIGGVEIVDRAKPPPKTKLRARELRYYKELLLAKRRELLGDVHQLSNEALHLNRQESRGDLSNMPSHMADVGSDNWEQEFTLGLIETERALLRQIDEALERIGNGTYGVCLATHRMIPPERLQAKPWARYCIEFARLSDAGRVPPGLV
jgi:DnaK suppressor protein